MNWNHNTHYHGFVMKSLPVHCRRALDVGCGRGGLARKLAPPCEEVIGIDSDSKCLAHADCQSNVSLFHGGVLTYPFLPASFNFVVAVATLHPLPLLPALEKFAAALPISSAIRFVCGEEQVGAPIQAPAESLNTLRRESAAILPGVDFRRPFFDRYKMVWAKPKIR